MAERGRIYRWARNRSLGDAKARPVIVIAPDAATAVLERWVVVPISSDPRLEAHPLAVPLSPDEGSGLERSSFAMSWLPTTVLSEQLQGPIGRTPLRWCGRCSSPWRVPSTYRCRKPGAKTEAGAANA